MYLSGVGDEEEGVIGGEEEVIGDEEEGELQCIRYVAPRTHTTTHRIHHTTQQHTAHSTKG